jgi:hypothetical protein
VKIPVADQFEQSQSRGPTALVDAPKTSNAAPVQLSRMGESMQYAGRVGTGIAADMQRDINEAKVKERDNAVAEQVRDLTSGYLNAIGKDAVDGAKAAREKLEQIARDAGSDLGNPVQQKMASEIAHRRVQSALAQVGDHEAKQSRVYAVGQSQARAASAGQDMLANVGDEARYGQARSTMLAEVRKSGQLLGKSPEEIAQLEKNALSASHTDIVNALMAQNQGTLASTYMREHGSEIDPERRAILQNRLDAVSVKDKSLTTFLQMGAQSYAARIESANKMFSDGKIDAETHDALMQRIDHAESQQNKRQSDYDRSMLGRAQDWVLQNPQASVQEMPDNLYAWAKQNGSLASLNSLANRPTVSDTATLYAVNEMLDTTEGQARFANEFDINTVRDKLSDSDFLKLQTLQRKTGDELKKAMSPRETSKRVLTQIQAELGAARIDPTPNNKRDQDEWARFSNKLREEITLRTDVKGTPLTDDEARQVGLDLLKEGKISVPWAPDHSRRAYEVKPEQVFTPKASMVVEDYLNNPIERTRIEAAVAERRPDLVPGTPDFEDVVEAMVYDRISSGAQ